jgi:hypothetical protein
MTDKELLELAAKAACLTGKVWWDEDGYGYPDGSNHWNPLTDDADCFRLETAFGLNVTWHVYADSASQTRDAVQAGNAIEKYAAHNGDKYKARRYASTRAAAEIGKQKE